MRRKWKIRHGVSEYFSLFSATALFAAAVISPAFCVSALSDALSLCAKTLVPSLFPYITATNLISSCGVLPRISETAAGRYLRRLSGLSGAGVTAVIVGLISGFPSGAVFLGRMKRSGEIGSDEAARLMPFVNNASPAFVLGAVGSLFGSPALGATLFAAQCVASLSGIAVGRRSARSEKGVSAGYPYEPFISAFPRAVGDSALAMLSVCGFVAVFSIPCRALSALGRAGAFLSAFLEIGNGCAGAAASGMPSAAAFAVGFSGLSVMFQAADHAVRERISMKYWLPGKLYSGIICVAAVNIASFFGFI